ncbi:MAG: N-6 DNA methylase [bacterium]
MTKPQTRDERLLWPARATLENASRSLGAEQALAILEHAAALHAGLDVDGIGDGFGRARHLRKGDAVAASAAILHEIQSTGIPPPIAFAALADRACDSSGRRQAGAFYTDSRLAQHLVAALPSLGKPKGPVLDPACGAGILLAARAVALQNEAPKQLDEALATRFFGVDRDPLAVRGARLALASAASRASTVQKLGRHLATFDSLIASDAEWKGFLVDAPAEFLANPPWEQPRPSRHEYVAKHDEDHHYGAPVRNAALANFATERDSIIAYSHAVRERFPVLGGGQLDVSSAFLALSLELMQNRGHMSVLMPAGLIRNSGTRRLRAALFDGVDALRFDVLDNKGRHFPIDSRFKFLLVSGSPASAPGDSFDLGHPHTPNGHVAQDNAPVRLMKRGREVRRPDFLIPEVRNKQELNILRKMNTHGQVPEWLQRPGSIVRELDMTNHRNLFRREHEQDHMALIEGRMVHQYDAGAKAFRSGTGRRAEWEPLGPYANRPEHPQFWVDEDQLPERLQDRVEHDRVGFCDITGQTNERTMLASWIPAGTVCGNKVPTVLPSEIPVAWEELVAVWNSFAFDWFMRRYVTNTVNFFILRKAPLPVLSEHDTKALRVASEKVARYCHEEGPKSQARLFQIGMLRGTIEALVARGYGLAAHDVEVLLNDFPSVDRNQPRIQSESPSVTRDLVLAAAWAHEDVDRSDHFAGRAKDARQQGAAPYVPTQATQKATA